MADDTPLDATLDVDAVLRDELAVEPSPAFLPRVRQKIAYPAPRRWRWMWIVPATAAATLFLVAALPSSVRAPQAPAPPHVSLVGLTPELRAVSQAPAVPRSGRLVPRTDNRTPGTGYRQPEVLVDQRQRDALLSFMRMIDDGHLPADAFKHTTAPPVDVAEEVFEIFSHPVAVSPIVVGGVLHFDVRRN